MSRRLDFYKPKRCQSCCQMFRPTASRQRFCSPCGEEYAKVTWGKSARKREPVCKLKGKSVSWRRGGVGVLRFGL